MAYGNILGIFALLLRTLLLFRGARCSVVVKALSASRKVTGSSPNEVNFLN
jgi:hypothetical protein